ncbi:MAG: preprotein translocase subunit SecD [Ilumatobacter sp.]|jgi:preprotein translocase subunit SecD|uniref:preprotein translocase subunit SecD n=1 Tax=Ilumatobacter sp. TaxID=1967498 RepID=UPI00391B9A33
MTRRLWMSLVGTILVVAAALGGNLVTGNTPILGLDLQGGVSVILAPVEEASGEDLIVIRDLVRQELENFGIAEPDVRVQGQTIVVDLPGVDDQQEALEAVNVSGVVQLRPVVNPFECQAAPTALTPDFDLSTATTDSTDPASTDPDATGDADGPQPLRQPPATEVPTTEVPATEVPTTEVPATEVPTTDPVVDPAPPILDPVPTAPVTPGAELLPSRDGLPLCVGPDQNTTGVLVFERGGAEATLNPGWGVVATLRGGDGRAFWNSLASQCFSRTSTCASGQLAIVLDGVIQSAPTVNQPNFDDQVSITGNFTEDEARSLARVLNRGAFPVEIEAQEARTVSASAGSDSLRAAIIAGLLGVMVVLALLLAYYRWFSLVIVGGMVVWAATVFSVSAFVSSATNYSLSLAGITGIIVAVGVTVDSYVVFFERMKDEIRNGRTLRNAAPRSFTSTWRTIWSADLVSMIGAAILFWLSVGSVRGFALYLGITTLCDLFVCYFFTRPSVLLLARSKFMVGKKAFGLEVAK